jgi:hypothetical protein
MANGLHIPTQCNDPTTDENKVAAKSSKTIIPILDGRVERPQLAHSIQ